MLALWQECSNSLGKSTYALIHWSPVAASKSSTQILEAVSTGNKKKLQAELHFSLKKMSNPIFFFNQDKIYQ